MLATEVAAVTNMLLTKIAASHVAVVRTKHASIVPSSSCRPRLGDDGQIAAMGDQGIYGAMTA
jgi:hypothetical protein